MTVSSWDVYQRRLNKSGTSQKNRIIANAQRTITDSFSNSPSYELVTVNGVSQDVQITEDNILRTDSNKKRIICKPDETISNGDLVVWDSENWLCTDTDDNGIHARGIIEKCNNSLVYLDSTGETVTVNCIITDRILMNQKENDYYILPDNKIWVIVDSNDETTVITEDQRFILNGNAYKVESIDNVTKSGLVIFKMKTDAIIEDDSVALGIANYTSKSHSYSIVILNGSDAEITLNESLQLQLECTDNSEVVVDPTITYSLTTGSTGVISVSASGVILGSLIGSGNVVATYNSATDSIDIDIVTAALVSYSYDLVANIQPENEVKYGQTKSFTAYKYYNTGTVVTGSVFEFTVNLGTGASSSNYLLTTSSDVSVSLKCLQYPYSISLVATDQDILANTVTQVISLKGLV